MSGFVFTDRAAERYRDALHALLPDEPLWRLDEPQAASADVAVSWAPAAGAFSRLPNVKLIHSIGAGVDQILAEDSGRHLPVCRIVDPEQVLGMSHYVLWGVLNYYKGFDRMRAAQSAHRWERNLPTSPGEWTIGIMGMGAMGKGVAAQLLRAGFPVRGWSRTPASVEGVQCFSEDGLPAFLGGTDILVCLLPLTPETHRILDADLFDRLPKGAHLIHVGRGEHLDGEALACALDRGQLSGALIDVFEQEPLPASDPLWDNAKVIITPHVAALSSAGVVAGQIAANVRRLRKGLDLMNGVERARGY